MLFARQVTLFNIIRKEQRQCFEGICEVVHENEKKQK